MGSTIVGRRSSPARRLRNVTAVDVVWFNATTYAASVAGVAIAWAASRHSRIPRAARIAARTAMLSGVWWAVASTLAATWVFDVSGVTRWRWLREFIGESPRRWLNVTTGFDDTTDALTVCFPDSSGIAVDLFDERGRHDRSILRARQAFPPESINVVPGWPLPLESDSVDAAFLLMAAHELRDDDIRRALFDELRRVLGKSGRVVLVEYLRTPTNAVVFGPGVLHFFSGNLWRETARRSGFAVAAERSLTPFAHAFLLVEADETR